MYFLTLSGYTLLCSDFVVTLIERVTIRVSVFKAFFCSLRSLDGISHYISFNFG